MEKAERIEKFYTKKEAAKILRISICTLSNWISQRKIAAKRGKPVLISATAINDYVRKRTDKAVDWRRVRV